MKHATAPAFITSVVAMNNAQKETIDLLIDYINAEDWGSIQVILRGQFLDVFDPINEAKQ